MVRRIIVFAVACLALTAGTAYASLKWNTAMKGGTGTLSRKFDGKCSFGAGSKPGWLLIRCAAGGTATATYRFTSARDVKGTPTSTIDPAIGKLVGVSRKLSVSDDTLTLKVTLSGYHAVQIHSVSVSYYTS
jgi:hypothetical protein